MNSTRPNDQTRGGRAMLCAVSKLRTPAARFGGGPRASNAVLWLKLRPEDRTGTHLHGMNQSIVATARQRWIWRGMPATANQPRECARCWSVKLVEAVEGQIAFTLGHP